MAERIIIAARNIRIAQETGIDPRPVRIARTATDHTPTWVSDTPDRG